MGSPALAVGSDHWVHAGITLGCIKSVTRTKQINGDEAQYSIAFSHGHLTLGEECLIELIIKADVAVNGEIGS
jgi:hypothetical protein